MFDVRGAFECEANTGDGTSMESLIVFYLNVSLLGFFLDQWIRICHRRTVEWNPKHGNLVYHMH